MDEANQFMYENKIRHLAVTEEEKVVGVLSVKDLVSYYAKIIPHAGIKILSNVSKKIPVLLMETGIFL